MGQQVSLSGYFVVRKVIRTKYQQLMSFATWVDEEGQLFDSTHFPQTLEKHPFSGPGCYLLEGKVVEEFGFHSIEVSKMQHLKIVPDARFTV